MSSMRMIGPSCHTGPGGRDCACCNEAPGKSRRQIRRVKKRAERNQWKRKVREEF
jgi:hypothetical protein